MLDTLKLAKLEELVRTQLKQLSGQLRSKAALTEKTVFIVEAGIGYPNTLDQAARKQFLDMVLSALKKAAGNPRVFAEEMRIQRGYVEEAAIRMPDGMAILEEFDEDLSKLLQEITA